MEITSYMTVVIILSFSQMNSIEFGRNERHILNFFKMVYLMVWYFNNFCNDYLQILTNRDVDKIQQVFATFRLIGPINGNIHFWHIIRAFVIDLK